jgi:desulfoferrodoxin (superoxide reductase-like protein)
MNIKNGILTTLILLALMIPATIVHANIPTVMSIARRTVNGGTFIDIVVNHSDPTTNHYINQISLDLDGTTQTFTDLPKPTSTQYTFTLNIGSASPKTIKAQVVCNLHGPSSWFTEGTIVTTPSGGISGYPVEVVAAGILIAVTAIFVLHRRP